jgi:hypothetical protein
MSVKVEHWSVSVSVNGDEILTIESEWLSGVPNIDEYADAVRNCAQHLLAFIGPADPEPFFIPEDETHHPEGTDR